MHLLVDAMRVRCGAQKMRTESEASTCTHAKAEAVTARFPAGVVVYASPAARQWRVCRGRPSVQIKSSSLAHMHMHHQQHAHKTLCKNLHHSAIMRLVLLW